MTDEERQLEAMLSGCSCGGVGCSLPDDVLDSIRNGSENHPENTEPYDEEKLLEGIKIFCESHSNLQELR